MTVCILFHTGESVAHLLNHVAWQEQLQEMYLAFSIEAWDRALNFLLASCSCLGTHRDTLGQCFLKLWVGTHLAQHKPVSGGSH